MGCQSPDVERCGCEAEHAALYFRRDYPRIVRYITCMVHDTAEAEDLTQETFLRAYRHQGSLREEAAHTAWLYRIATNVSLDRLRQRARRSPMEADADLDVADIAEPGAPSLQQIVERDEMSACVQGYLDALPDNYRAVLLLYEFHALTAPEIAHLLGESLANVKIRLHRARRKLKTALEAGCAFEYDERNVLTCEPRR